MTAAASSTQPSRLAERASAPARLQHPAATGGLTFRSLTAADAAAVLAIIEACAPVDLAEERATLEDVVEELALPWLDLAADTVAGVDDSGTLQAYGVVQRRPGATRLVQAGVAGAVHPRWRGRGVGRALLAWQVGRARQLLAGVAEAEQQLPAVVRADVEDANAAGTAAVRAAGFTPTRYYTTMRRDLGAELPHPALADGVRLVPLAPARLAAGDSAPGDAGDGDGEGGGLADAVRIAHNEAFAGHWGSEPFSAEQWRHRVVTSSGRRLDLSFAALDASGAAIGYLVSGTYPQDWEPQGFTEGWVDLLGVVPSSRRTGLGRALLATAMRAFRAERLEYAGLGVDVDNPSALDLYTGLGFEASSRSTSWTIAI